MKPGSSAKVLWPCLGLALALRCASAFITEFHPIFPAYYYTDARLYEEDERLLAKAWRDSSASAPLLSTGRELYTFGMAAVYYGFGEHPLLPKLVNAGLGVVSILFWYKIASLLFGESASLIALLLLAFWPTHIFYTSQNLKESATLLTLSGIFYLFLNILSSPQRQSWRRQAALASGALAVVLLGFFRAYLVPVVGACLIAGGLASMFENRRERLLAAGGAWVCLYALLAVLLYKPVSHYALKRLHSAGGGDPNIFLKGVDPSNSAANILGTMAPFGSPQWVTQFRRIRQLHDQIWAQRNAGRSIQTQLFPGAEFKTWSDVLLFLPKGMFYILFMPLPGLYPMGAKMGRMLASLENVMLLALFIAAVWGWSRCEKKPATWPLVLFFALVVLPSAFLEFDLGSATRHRLQFFPFIFPFAALALSRKTFASKGTSLG